MSMQEALEWAADYAERTKLFDPVLNSRGYPDGWKPPTPAEKARVITELAKEMYQGSILPAGSKVIADRDYIAMKRTLLTNLADSLQRAKGNGDWILVSAVRDNLVISAGELLDD